MAESTIPRSRRALRLAPWLPVGLGGVWCVAVLATLPSLVRAMYANSDVAALPVLGEVIGNAPRGTTVTLGNIPWYSALWFEQLTSGLPAHRAIWELFPWLLGLIGIAITAWVTGRIAGRWAGWTLAAVCGCSGSALLLDQVAWSVHAVAYFHICLLGAFIFVLATSGPVIGGRMGSHLIVLGAVAVITGLGIACDPLVIVGGLGPVAAAGLVLGVYSPAASRPVRLGSLAAVIAGSVAVAALVSGLAHDQHLAAAAFPIDFSATDQLFNHVGNLISSLMVLFNGGFDGAAPSLTSGLSAVCACLVVAGIYAALRIGRRAALDLAPEGVHDTIRATGADRGRVAFLAFWMASAVAVSLAFVLSDIPRGYSTARYVVTVGYAAVVLLAVGAGRRRGAVGRWSLAAGASVIIAASILAVLQSDMQRGEQPSAARAAAVLRVARAEHVTVGYAGYWDALSISWSTHEALPVRPLLACGGAYCSFPYNRIISWYRPRRAIRSMLVIDPQQAAGNNGVVGPLASFGKPLASMTVDGLTLYVYGYDLAAKLPA